MSQKSANNNLVVNKQIEIVPSNRFIYSDRLYFLSVD